MKPNKINIFYVNVQNVLENLGLNLEFCTEKIIGTLL